MLYTAVVLRFRLHTNLEIASSSKIFNTLKGFILLSKHIEAMNFETGNGRL